MVTRIIFNTIDRLRPLSYPNTHVFLLCYSVVSSSSFSNINKKWWPEIKHHAGGGACCILVGTKSDLKQDPNIDSILEKQGEKVVTLQEAESLKIKIGAHKYVECSAKNLTGVKQVFDEAMRAVIFGRKGGKGGSVTCTIL